MLLKLSVTFPYKIFPHYLFIHPFANIVFSNGFSDIINKCLYTCYKFQHSLFLTFPE